MNHSSRFDNHVLSQRLALFAIHRHGLEPHQWDIDQYFANEKLAYYADVCEYRIVRYL